MVRISLVFSCVSAALCFFASSVAAQAWEPTPVPQLPATVPVPQPNVAVPPTVPPPLPPNEFPAPPAPDDTYAPYLCPPCRQPGGYFGVLELGLVAPEITGGVRGRVRTAGVPRRVEVPFVDLDWSGSPHLEFGYRFADGSGAIAAGYRAVVSEGAENVLGLPTNPLGESFVRSRLNMNIIDLNYRGPHRSFASLWDFHWDAGARIGAAYFDSRAMSMTATQRVANNYIGAGPRAGIGIRRFLPAAPGFALFGRIEAALLFGEATQSFEDIRRVGGVTVGGASRFSETQTVPVVGVQLGGTYSPPDSHWLRFMFGYQYETWWNAGGIGGSDADVSFQGVFLRGEFRF